MLVISQKENHRIKQNKSKPILCCLQTNSFILFGLQQNKTKTNKQNQKQSDCASCAEKLKTSKITSNTAHLLSTIKILQDFLIRRSSSVHKT